jgi:asparagine synthase (glutamine-hydrolysing)
MSVQFGRWNFDGTPPSAESIKRATSSLVPYGPDGAGSYSNGGVTISYRAFHTTSESRAEEQPHISTSGRVFTWDGRLDNRADLIDELHDPRLTPRPDVSLAAAAYECWGKSCFAKFIGDWALSVWDPRDRFLLLAKDPIGTRHLYYSLDDTQITWSTILDPLILFAEHPFQLDEEYLAGCLSFFPATHLTPYVGVHSVPPSSCVRVCPGRRAIERYWQFDPTTRIRYSTDAEYEEHFRELLSTSIRRRLRADTPVLAELSGGMDSSSIVCVADDVVAEGNPSTPRLDTISYYNDSEPNWNERPYFTKVEERRGRIGRHIEVGSQAQVLDFNARFSVTPGSGGHPSPEFVACMTSQGYRVVLSGIGGDEVTGGVPTPAPELADLVAQAKLCTLAHQLMVWALNKRKPWFYLLWDAVRAFLPASLVGIPPYKRPVPWLRPDFVRRHHLAFMGYETRLKLLGSLPTFQENLSTLQGVQRQLECEALSAEPPYEKRYPYLDRDLLEFLYAIPREQLVRPGQRRSLMRRALAGIVPGEILNRKRKAYVGRAPFVSISAQWADLVNMTQNLVSDSLGIVDGGKFAETLQRAKHGQEIPMVILLRTLLIESWLKNHRAWSLSTFLNLRSESHADEAPQCDGVRDFRDGDSTSAPYFS